MIGPRLDSYTDRQWDTPVAGRGGGKECIAAPPSRLLGCGGARSGRQLVRTLTKFEGLDKHRPHKEERESEGGQGVILEMQTSLGSPNLPVKSESPCPAHHPLGASVRGPAPVNWKREAGSYRIMNRTALIAVPLVILASALVWTAARTAKPVSRRRRPILVVTNGRIVTVEESQPEAQAIAIGGDRIVALGIERARCALRRAGDAGHRREGAAGDRRASSRGTATSPASARRSSTST